jgi:hypothetical protein
MKRGEKTLIFIWKRGICGKTDYMQYDNAVLPILREEPGWRSLYSCWLQAEWSGDRIPVGGKVFHAYQNSSKAHPATNEWVKSLLQELKWLEHGADHQPSLSTGYNGSVLYFHLPSVPAHRCHGVPFTFATTADRVKHFKISPFLPL